jgi:circadian clock protein KaiB
MSHFRLRLYVVEGRPSQDDLVENMERVLDRHLDGRYALTVVDVQDDPEAAARDGILVVPTLICESEGPTRRMVGSFRDEQRLIAELGLCLATDDLSRSRGNEGRPVAEPDWAAAAT